MCDVWSECSVSRFFSVIRETPIPKIIILISHRYKRRLCRVDVAEYCDGSCLAGVLD